MRTWDYNQSVLNSSVAASRPKSEAYYLGHMIEKARQGEEEEQRRLNVLRQKDEDEALERQYKLSAMKTALDEAEKDRQGKAFELALLPYKPSNGFNWETGENVTTGSMPLGDAAVDGVVSAAGVPAFSNSIAAALKYGLRAQNLAPNSKGSPEALSKSISDSLESYDTAYSFAYKPKELYTAEQKGLQALELEKEKANTWGVRGEYANQKAATAGQYGVDKEKTKGKFSVTRELIKQLGQNAAADSKNKSAERIAQANNASRKQVEIIKGVMKGMNYDNRKKLYGGRIKNAQNANAYRKAFDDRFKEIRDGFLAESGKLYLNKQEYEAISKAVYEQLTGMGGTYAGYMSDPSFKEDLDAVNAQISLDQAAELETNKRLAAELDREIAAYYHPQRKTYEPL